MLPFAKHWCWFLLPLCLLAMSWERQIFNFPFFGDDFKLLRHLQPLHLGDVPTYLDPHWGWAYRPFMLIYWSGMMRLTDNVAGYHLVSVLLHLGTSALMGLLCWRLLGATRQKRALASAAAGIGAFFWLGQSEAVLLASDVSVLFCAFFIFCALHAFLSYRQTGKSGAAIACLLALLAALGFKEEAVAAPALCLLIDLHFLPKKPTASARNLWIYGVMGVVLCLFAGASLVANASIDTLNPKIIPIPRHISLFSVADFYLQLLARVISTSSSLLNFGVAAAMAAMVYQQKSAPTRGAFWMVAAVSAPVPLMTGGYSLSTERFFYAPWLFLIMAVAVLICTSRVRASSTFPLVAAALAAGAVRQTLEYLAQHNGTFNEIQNAFLLGDALVPCSLVASVLLALGLWKKGTLDTRIPVTVVTVALCSQSGVWPTLPWLGELLGIVAFAVCGLTFNRENKGRWIEGIFIAAALWLLPALTLPLVVVFALLHQQKFVAWPIFASLHLRIGKEHHAHL